MTSPAEASSLAEASAAVLRLAHENLDRLAGQVLRLFVCAIEYRGAGLMECSSFSVGVDKSADEHNRVVDAFKRELVRVHGPSLAEEFRREVSGS